MKIITKQSQICFESANVMIIDYKRMLRQKSASKISKINKEEIIVGINFACLRDIITRYSKNSHYAITCLDYK